MNLHVTDDTYGLYTLEIVERIKNSTYKKNNHVLTLSENVVFKDESVDYIPGTKISYKKFISKAKNLNKIIFHPYNFTCYEFLKIVLTKFPNIRIYWVCWSYEFYNLPHVVNKLYEPFSSAYIKSKRSVFSKGKQILSDTLKYILSALGIKMSYWKKLKHLSSLPDYFCSPFPTDFLYLNQIIPQNHLIFESFAYLSINKLIPDCEDFISAGDKIMIGHCSSPDGNHYEVIEKISSICRDYPIFIPLSYGDMEYGSLIKKAAHFYFDHVEILEKTLDKSVYYRKLSEVGWAIINVKVQQGVGNIIGLLCMGVKVFLNKNSSIYIDFSNWGVIIFNIQDHLNKNELETKLSQDDINCNKKIMLDIFGEKKVSEYWQKILF